MDVLYIKWCCFLISWLVNYTWKTVGERYILYFVSLGEEHEKMPSQIKDIIETIEQLRIELNEIKVGDKVLLNLKLLEKSQELDKMICLYYELILE